MNIRKRWLSSALAVQVLVASFFMWQTHSPLTRASAEPVFADLLARLDRLNIDDGDQSVTLIKTGDQWHLETETALPVDQSKIAALVDDLSAIKPTIPVVTRKSNHQRFEVDQDDYYRKVTLYHGGDELKQFYVGTTPAVRQSHVRFSDSDDVYALPLNRFDLSVSRNSWLNKNLLQAQQFTSIESAQWRAQKQDSTWVLTRSDGAVIDDETSVEKVEDLVDSLQTLRVIAEATDVSKDELTLQDSLTVAGEQQWQYNFYQSNGETYVARDDIDAVFKLSAREFDKLANLDFSEVKLAEGSDTEAAIVEAESEDS